jgi:hypothetical protein
MKSKVIVAAFVALFLVGSTVNAADIGFKGIGAKVGLIGPEGGIGSTLGFGAVVELGTIIPNLALEAEVLYWSKGYDYSWGSWSYSDIIIGALGKYFFSKKSTGMQPYAGGGLGLAMFKGSWKDNSGYTDYFSDYSSSDIAITGLAGIEYLFSPSMKGFAEFRYTTGGWDFWGIFGGIIFKMGK